MIADHYGRTSRQFRRMRQRVLEQSDICWLCGQGGADTVDHIIPRSVAPHLAEQIENLASAHRACNSSRGAKLVDQARRVPTSRAW